MRSARTARTAKNLNNINKTKVNNTSTKVTSPKDKMIDEIIKLSGQINANNKRFASTKDNFTIQKRHDALDYTFRKFEREISIDNSDIANNFHVKANDSLNITKSKKFYRQISDKNLNILLNSLRDFQYGKKANKNLVYKNQTIVDVTIDGKVEKRIKNKTRTYAGWKKQYDEYLKNKMPNIMNQLKNGYKKLYEELRNRGMTDDQIIKSIIELEEDNDYRESDQEINALAEKHDALDKLYEDAIDTR